MPQGWVLLAAALALLAALGPVLAFSYPPLVDYPNHLARLKVLLDPDNAVLARSYVPDWRFVPNLGLDLFAVALGHLGISAPAAGKAFIAVTFVLQVGGVLVLGRVLAGRVTPWAAAGALVVFNYALHLGMLSFLFASALALWAFALHLWAMRRGRVLRVGLDTLSAGVLMVAHLYGFAVFALLVGVYALARVGLDWKELVARALPFVPAGALFLALSPTGQGASFYKTPDAMLKLTNLAHLSLFDGLAARAITLALAAGMLAVAGRALVRRRALFAPAMGWVVAAMAGLYVVMPQVMLSSGNADWRLLVPLALVACAALAVPLGRRAGLAVLVGVVGLSLTQAAAVHHRWAAADAHQRHMIAALADLPRGSRVFPAVFGTGYADAQAPVPWTHMAALGVVEHDLFVPTLFANRTQQPLAYTSADADLHRATRQALYFSPADVDWALVGSRFEYVVFIDPGGDAGRWAAEVPLTLVVLDAADPHILVARIAGGP